MSDDSESVSEEERSLFRPFTRESLAAIEARIAEEYAKQKELEKKRAEGEVSHAKPRPQTPNSCFQLTKGRGRL
jgi:voltage-gated sodium channel type II alpha